MVVAMEFLREREGRRKIRWKRERKGVESLIIRGK